MADTQRTVTVKVQAILAGTDDPFGRLADSAARAEAGVLRSARGMAAAVAQVGTAVPADSLTRMAAAAAGPRPGPAPSSLPPAVQQQASRVADAVHAGRSPTSAPTPPVAAFQQSVPRLDAMPQMQPQQPTQRPDQSDAIRRIQNLPPATVKLQADPALFLGQSADAVKKATSLPATVRLQADTEAAAAQIAATRRAAADAVQRPGPTPLLPPLLAQQPSGQNVAQTQRVKVETDTSALRQLQNLPPATVKLLADPSPFLGQSAEATRKIAASPATVKVTADVAQAQAKTEALSRAVGTLPATVKVGADTSPFTGQTSEAMRRATTSPASVRVTADPALFLGQSADAARKVASSPATVRMIADPALFLGQSVEAVRKATTQPATVKLQADTAAAMAKSESLLRSIGALPATVKVGADTSAAAAKLAAIRQQGEKPMQTRLDVADAAARIKLTDLQKPLSLRLLGDPSPLVAEAQSAVARINRMTAAVQINAGAPTLPIAPPRLDRPFEVQPSTPQRPALPALFAQPVPPSMPQQQVQQRQVQQQQPINPAPIAQARQATEQLARAGEQASGAFLRTSEGIMSLSRGLMMLSAGNRQMEDLLRTLMLVQGISDTFKGVSGIIGGMRDAAAARSGATAIGGLGHAAAGAAGARMMTQGAPVAAAAGAQPAAAASGFMVPASLVVASVGAVALAATAHTKEGSEYLAKNNVMGMLPTSGKSWFDNVNNFISGGRTGIMDLEAVESQEAKIKRLEDKGKIESALRKSFPGFTAMYVEEAQAQDIRTRAPFREQSRRLDQIQQEAEGFGPLNNQVLSRFNVDRQRNREREQFSEQLRAAMSSGNTTDLQGTLTGMQDVLAGKRGYGDLGSLLAGQVRTDRGKGTAQTEQNLAATERQSASAMREVKDLQQQIADQQQQIKDGRRDETTSLARQWDLQNQLAAAGQRLLDAEQRRLQAARDHNMAEVERVALIGRQFTEASKMVQMQLEGEKGKLAAMKEQFGIQDAMTRQAVASVAEKLGRGEDLNKQELELARSQPLLGEKLGVEGQRRAVEDDTLRRIEAALGTNQKVQALEQTVKQFNAVTVELNNKVSAELKINEEALAKQIAEQVVPLLKQMQIQTEQSLISEMSKNILERAMNQKPLTGQ